MEKKSRTIMVCSCEGTMPLDVEAVRRGCSAPVVQSAHQLCRAELERFRAAAAAGEPMTVTCTQEAPLFSEAAGENAANVAFVNIRETAGWSAQAGEAAPKMAALIAAAAVAGVAFMMRRSRPRVAPPEPPRAPLQAPPTPPSAAGPPPAQMPTGMRACPNCGRMLPAVAEFCGFCGQRIQ